MPETKLRGRFVFKPRDKEAEKQTGAKPPTGRPRTKAELKAATLKRRRKTAKASRKANRKR